MNRSDSQMMKGVAILLMIFLHLFNQMPNVDLCRNFIYIGNLPLVYVLTRAANPVAFFLILGGYGLYKVWLRGDKNRWSRLWKLMFHYWIILAVFLSVGYYLFPDRYPNSFAALISNATGFHTTYNGEMWFLLPYIVLSAMAPWLFKVCIRFKWWQVIGVAFCIHLATSFCISRYGSSFLFHNYAVYDPLLVLHLTFSFLVGAMAERESWFEFVKSKCKNIGNLRILASVGVMVCVITACSFKYFYPYAFCIITLVYLLKFRGLGRTILEQLGSQSMNMWMIHTWLCYYLFKEEFYSLRYPLLIMAAVTAASYALGLFIDKLSIPVLRIASTLQLTISSQLRQYLPELRHQR